MLISDWSSDVCSSDLLSGTDQEAQVDIVIAGGTNGAADRIVGPVCRKDGTGTVTFYQAGIQSLSGGTAFRLYKVVGGVPTQLGSDATIGRSEERRGGKEWGSTGRSRWEQFHYK